MTSLKDTIEARLFDYAKSIEDHIAQFANAPIHAVALATTGASYLIGKSAEDELVEQVMMSRGLPLVTAALAVCDALEVLNARRIALISPYPTALTDASVGYWQSRNLEVVRVVSVFEDSKSFHPIYALAADAAGVELASVKDCGAEAVVMLGTGMPTLPTIAANTHWDGPPILSCMLALVWRSVMASSGQKLGKSGLMDWIAARHWRARIG
jgi:maleate cis-trans isomerase